MVFGSLVPGPTCSAAPLTGSLVGASQAAAAAVAPTLVMSLPAISFEHQDQHEHAGRADHQQGAAPIGGLLLPADLLQPCLPVRGLLLAHGRGF